ncbi:acyl-CoA synthetase (AMP-forming)/AMP-acid ligase II [Sphingomonas endophytica]|uniref:Acyl-CoA synthetase (AMP-forming)/AMP-acid ligase II n=1 Tax=Sphingomonas endophytica TaxID=869719 RepID=A0A7X0JEE8_9SPHN|nr:AMP-binding protein [Sphingomonas endophytica]MBB6505237.1 acyl-CoA synthetase (AMP-forming)/AMP-acid ligase II [Sphingomonas endophytica]
MTTSDFLSSIAAIDPAQLAVLDDAVGEWISYGALRARAAAWAAQLSGARALVFLYASNDVETVAALLGGMQAGHAIALFDPALPPASRDALEKAYAPEWIVEGGQAHRRPHPAIAGDLHPALAILLSTSGSTGSPKLVRLTQAAIAANAAGIAQVLDVRDDDVAAGYLPLHYSYGLSVLTSHLVRGARIRLTSAGLTDRSFWPAMRAAGVSHMPGVPFHHQVMMKLGFARLDLTKLRTLTQAGGAMDAELRQRCHDHMRAIGGHFYILYGQTEAAPRMTTLQPADFLAAPTSVGTPLPDCRLEIVEADTQGAGEVVFHGPNVMMGYAECRADLARGDELGGTLRTGDVGYLDDAGRLHLTGRVKRFGKVYGLRVNLDDVEMVANGVCDSAVTQEGEALVVSYAHDGDDEAVRQTMIGRLTDRFTVTLTAYRFRRLATVPRTPRGKVDYKALETAT